MYFDIHSSAICQLNSNLINKKKSRSLSLSSINAKLWHNNKKKEEKSAKFRACRKRGVKNVIRCVFFRISLWIALFTFHRANKRVRYRIKGSHVHVSHVWCLIIFFSLLSYHQNVSIGILENEKSTASQIYRVCVCVYVWDRETTSREMLMHKIFKVMNF